MMRILIFGASGMLGSAAMVRLKQLGHDPHGLTRNAFDIARDPLESIYDELASADAVLNCSGVIKPMIATTPIEEVLSVNAIFPRNLGRVCKSLGIPLVHITTDCVFSGATGGYDEAALFDADDVYGMSKNAGETEDAMVLRTSIIGEEFGKSRSLLAWAQSQKGRAVNGFTNHRWNGLAATYLCDAIHEILEQHLFALGVFHLYSPDTVTKDQLLRILSDVYDLNLSISPIAAEVGCDRSLASRHSLSARIVTKPIQKQVEEMRRSFELHRRAETEKAAK